MPYMSREKFALWWKNTIAAIEYINKLTDSELTGKDFYALEYRGKNHRLVLAKDGDTIARGIYEIEKAIQHLYIYYRYIERR